jgi:hypothetical protein
MGFRYDIDLQEYTYNFPVYKSCGKTSLICKLWIDEESIVHWKVCDVRGNTYPSYYNREYGKSEIVPIIDKNISRELKKIGAERIDKEK